MIVLIYIVPALALGLFLGSLFTKDNKNQTNTSDSVDNGIDLSTAKLQTDPEKVRDFYNEYNDKFLEVYGEVIQAFRTHNVSKLLDYQIDVMELEEGLLCLDAGCGVCGPASYFAKQKGVKVEAITISDVQVEQAKELIQREGVTDLVKVKKGDYHKLPDLYPNNYFDRVYFLESFGHSFDHAKVLAGAWEVLKPGGILYIKDLFRKITAKPAHQKRIDETIDTINEAYRYNIADLYRVLHEVRKLGFVIMALKSVDIKLEDIENFTISKDFQELTGIEQIENWNTYFFPIEFYELKCYKPVHDFSSGTDKNIL